MYHNIRSREPQRGMMHLHRFGFPVGDDNINNGSGAIILEQQQRDEEEGGDEDSLPPLVSDVDGDGSDTDGDERDVSQAIIGRQTSVAGTNREQFPTLLERVALRLMYDN